MVLADRLLALRPMGVCTNMMRPAKKFLIQVRRNHAIQTEELPMEECQADVCRVAVCAGIGDLFCIQRLYA